MLAILTLTTAFAATEPVRVSSEAHTHLTMADGGFRLQRVGAFETAAGLGLVFASVDTTTGSVHQPAGYGAGLGVLTIGSLCTGLSLPITRTHTFKAARALEDAGVDLDARRRIRQVRSLQAVFWGGLVGHAVASQSLEQVGMRFHPLTDRAVGLGLATVFLANVSRTASLYDDALRSIDTTPTPKKRTVQLHPSLRYDPLTRQPVAGFGGRW